MPAPRFRIVRAASPFRYTVETMQEGKWVDTQSHDDGRNFSGKEAEAYIKDRLARYAEEEGRAKRSADWLAGNIPREYP